MLTKTDPLQSLQKDMRILLQHLQNHKSSRRFAEANRDTILESINDGVLVLDDQDNIRYTNRKLGEILAIDTLRWQDAHISQFYNFLLDQSTGQDLHRLQTVYYSVLGKQNLVADACELTWPRPKTRYLEVYTGPIRHDQRMYLGRVWKFEDISHQKELEQMKVELVSLASHQLRTPLTAIRGYLKMIEGGDYGELPAKLEQPLSVLMHSTEKMRDLINDLLDVSRLDSGTVEVKLQQVDLVEV
ncbi:hypothetical protein KC640_03315, partial [Candidatus Dojkabacteria bacterium]|nr:hypothetical protein [Candidatus Dojkabacteria bacterium]